MTNCRIHILAALVTVLAAGCQTWGPGWSELSGARYYNLTTLHRRQAIIERVDDQAAFASNPIKLAPGRHVILVQGPVTRPGGGYLKSLTVDMAPCKRYYVNAQFKNNVEPNFEPVVDYVESIAGCAPSAAR